MNADTRDRLLGLGFVALVINALMALVGVIGAMWVDASDIDPDVFDDVDRCTDALKEAGTYCANDSALDNQLVVVGVAGVVLLFVTFVIMAWLSDQ